MRQWNRVLPSEITSKNAVGRLLNRSNTVVRTPRQILDSIRSIQAFPSNAALAYLKSFWLILAIVLRIQGAQLEWSNVGAHRRAALQIESGGRVGFTEITAATSGIGFINHLNENRSLTNQIFLNGSGVAAGDVDGDGLCDLYLCGLDSPNALYRNLGNWRFEEISASAGVRCQDQASTGCALADIDGDGDLDLIVNGIAAGTRLFFNDGKGRFREATDAAGLRGTNGSCSMALADMDGDGFLDLYVVNYRNDTMRDMPDIQFSVGVTNGVYRFISMNGRPASAPNLQGRFTFDKAGGVLENGEADSLFRNTGHGRFQKLSWTDGSFVDEDASPIGIPYDWGLSAMFRDLNGDGTPDLYVCNDFQSPDRIWLNDGKGRFRAPPRSTVRQTSLFSMGVDAADIDRDGADDLFVADMLSREHARRQVQVMDARAFAQVRASIGQRPQVSRNTLLRNAGNFTFSELARFSGVSASDWSWCPVFLDADLDGYEDLLITTGHWRDAQHADIAMQIDREKAGSSMPSQEQLQLRRRFPLLDTPNVAFRNRGDLTFEDIGREWGFDSRSISQGMALADLDNDGDLDVVVNCLNGTPLVYRNNVSKPRIAVRLRGAPPNTRGVGAKVRVMAPGLPAQSQEMICGGRYLSSDDFMRTFAVLSAQDRVKIEVTWRNGRKSPLENVPANHVVEVNESDAVLAVAHAEPQTAEAYFEDVSEWLKHSHFEEDFDDFSRQPLLPRKLSRLGPGVTWFDFNGDGFDDLFIGAGKGGRMGVYRNDGGKGFIRQRAELLEEPVERDMTTILGWRPNMSGIHLLIGNANYEDGMTSAPAVRDFSLVTGVIDENLLRSGSSTGPMAMADVDGDGDLDLFVGGRVVAGRYPESASSALLQNENGRFRVNGDSHKIMKEIGLVSSALFSDLSGDRLPELILACEWGPLRIFRNKQGQLVPWNAPIRILAPSLRELGVESLDAFTGWWNSVVTGDFDGDGRLDIVAGNWGRNTWAQQFLSKPLQLHYGDSDGSGYLALIESHFDSALGRYVPARDRAVLSAAFPAMLERFPTFEAFAQTSTSELLELSVLPFRSVAAATLDSILLLNRGDAFEVHVLPPAAQMSPIFGITVGDFDGDGNEDLFLAQNFFEVAPSESRHDAGNGLWLRGDGTGQFDVPSLRETGLMVLGDARGAAVCDFDVDGRIDLVVGQNRGESKLYRNKRARPGLRVELKGPPQNSQAVGAIVRVAYPNGEFGPAHEIRLGGGYWSQDSNKLVLGTRDGVTALEIRWPGGFKERVPVPSGARSVTRMMPD
ncbi:MAG: FG-GAP-like repeat-containing protein [Verrucomicrobia bacterium]|nr:FG-GAP-like repeat-containing protein [Verrucomicrobiota bacterium]